MPDTPPNTPAEARPYAAIADYAARVQALVGEADTGSFDPRRRAVVPPGAGLYPLNHMAQQVRWELAERLRDLFQPSQGHETCFVAAERFAAQHWIAANRPGPDGRLRKPHPDVNVIAWYRRLAPLFDAVVLDAPHPCYPTLPAGVACWLAPSETV